MPTRVSAEARWRETWALLGMMARDEPLAGLCRKYGEPHRAYHNLEHIRSCLDLARSVRSELVHPEEVELALWYHDAIYDPARSDNEEESAAFAADQLKPLPSRAIASIAALILATKHAVAPPEGDARFVVDIDLAILGAAPEAFDAYETAIRSEYSWVPDALFRERRRDVMSAFLSRARIYSTDHFYRRLESAARANLGRSITRWS